MDSARLFMTQSSLEVLGKQIRFFMCRDPFFAHKICVEDILKIPCLALIFSLLWFSRDLRLVVERAPDLLVRSPKIVNWLLNLEPIYTL